MGRVWCKSWGGVSGCCPPRCDDMGILADSSALLSFLGSYSSAPSLWGLKSSHRTAVLSPESAMNGDPGKNLPPAPLNPVVLITWAICLCRVNMTISYYNPAMKKRRFYFSPCHFALLGWHLKEEKRQKATTNGICDEKREARLPSFTHFAASHIKGPVVSVRTRIPLCTHIGSLADPIL